MDRLTQDHQQIKDSSRRQVWMAILAKASLEALEHQVSTLADRPTYRFLRPPETGLVMVRGRTGGTGTPFNLGEIPLTRCVVQIGEPGGAPIAGFGYVAGRSHRHAELAALCDALLQHPAWGDRVQTAVIEPLQRAAQHQQEQQARQVETTRVNFFTMARGDG